MGARFFSRSLVTERPTMLGELLVLNVVERRHYCV